ncbi:MAG: ATP-binding protein [Clostridiales Family XIII bacterium]|nr:ATP-binding protein [Clostridiales Family XIII bacterium]
MFIGRSRELDYLNKRYESDKLEFAVIYGRRRVGKTTLINEFIKDKETIFYTGIEGNAKENLEALSKSIFAVSEDFTDASGSFAGFQEALETAFKIAEKRRIVFVIDEYPYLANCYRAISSILQVLIDRNKYSSKMYLILCGSSMSFMENQVNGYQSPLFGRRTCQFKIFPFEFFEVKEYFEKFNIMELAVIYGITGGIPLYMSMMDENLSIEENIKTYFLGSNAYLFEEPTNLIKQECRDPAQYNSIIKAIAAGASRMSEICTKTGIDTALAASYLNKLISLGIVKKEKPFGVNNSRKSIYALEDSMFRFWYRFIPDNITAIQRGLVEIVYQKIAPQITAFMGGVFEEICKQYLWALNRQGEAAIPFINLGRWWGNDPKNKCETEIDIMGTSDNTSAIFCECKWTNENIDTAVLDALIERSRLFHYTDVHFYLFAKTGFTKGCQDKANALGNVTMVKFEDMALKL